MNHTEIRALARMLDRLDYYRLLRVDRSAPASQIRAAYHQMRRSFHPDSFLGEGEEIREAVSRISRRLNEGYLVLRDTARREAYDGGLEQGSLRYTAETEDSRRTASEAQSGQTANGKRFFGRAQAAERSGDLVGAVSNLKMALTFEPNNEHFQQKLEELRARVPARKKSSNPYVIR